VYLVYNHKVSHATIEEIMDDAAFEAYMGLRARRFGAMIEDQFRLLPCHHHELGWAMMKPEGLDPTTTVVINFAHELMKQNEWLTIGVGVPLCKKKTLVARVMSSRVKFVCGVNFKCLVGLCF
jgi:hypothetical protein